MSFEVIPNPVPAPFPTHDPRWELPRSSRHVAICALLRAELRRVVGARGTVGGDQFVHFDGTHRFRKCAPDAFVRLGASTAAPAVWKTWEDGVPELCVEILANDTKEALTLRRKLEAAHVMGVREVICFDMDAAAGSRLRAWDRVDANLVERAVHDERTPCLTLGTWIHVAPLEEQPSALVVTDDDIGSFVVERRPLGETVWRPLRPRFLSDGPEWDLGQSSIHYKLTAFMWQALRRIVGRGSTVAADAYVYFEDKESSRYVVPDVFVRLGVPDGEFSEWYPWETGAPDLCVEFLHGGEMSELQGIEQKIRDLRDVGVREVVSYNFEADEGRRLRAWDRIDDELVEREVRGERTPCRTLGKWFHVAPLGEVPRALAIADDEAGNGMILPDAQRADAAEARVRELEELLRSKG